MLFSGKIYKPSIGALNEASSSTAFPGGYTKVLKFETTHIFTPLPFYGIVQASIFS